jgi:hypothetical protein
MVAMATATPAFTNDVSDDLGQNDQVVPEV